MQSFINIQHYFHTVYASVLFHQMCAHAIRTTFTQDQFIHILPLAVYSGGKDQDYVGHLHIVKRHLVVKSSTT